MYFQCIGYSYQENNAICYRENMGGIARRFKQR